MKRIAVVLAGIAVSEPAWALDYWMWGVGPKIGTTFLPGRYPLKFPGMVEDDLIDVGGEQVPSIQKVGGDFIAGLNATYYASSSTRLGVDAGFDLGASYFGANFMLEYNWVKQSSALDFLLGRGAHAEERGVRLGALVEHLAAGEDLAAQALLTPAHAQLLLDEGLAEVLHERAPQRDEVVRAAGAQHLGRRPA